MDKFLRLINIEPNFMNKHLFYNSISCYKSTEKIYIMHVILNFLKIILKYFQQITPSKVGLPSFATIVSLPSLPSSHATVRLGQP